MQRALILSIFLLFLQILHAQQNRVSFLFAGDAMQHQSQIDAGKTSAGYDYTSCFKYVKDSVQAADIAVVNLEVTHAGKPYTGYPSFCAPDEFSVALKDAGFDIFLTCNNHSLDKRKKGLERTIKVLDSLKVKHTGTFINQEKRDTHYPLMMIKNGIRIAILNYTYGTNGLTVQSPNIVNYIDKKQILNDIDMAKILKADIIVANMHWGLEYKLQPNSEQKELADFLIQHGVKLVIGSHPHVVQPIDIRRNESGEIDAVVVYSLSNFISAMKIVNATGGLMVNIDISKEEDKPVKIERCDYSLVWVNKKEKNGKFNFFELLPVEAFDNEEGKAHMGEQNFSTMQTFAKTARATVESMGR
ncbi:CapA family protein [Dysgonomonas sp. 25]|uniref:CapA family protein n=1 Tax=Dysgonomonas sp. 25 TaxID=2302933 RepID=UPI0013D54E6B|nr:CapA family protein [Dysgonomonas sp. 25]NDV69844.1 CapA family protein [Dysgonomonas sp. 25]